jgi:hypothetical protein
VPPSTSPPITVRARAYDDDAEREVLPDRVYVLLLDFDPRQWPATVRRLNDHLQLIERLDHQIRAQDYRLELYAQASGAHVLTWHYTEEI